MVGFQFCCHTVLPLEEQSRANAESSADIEIARVESSTSQHRATTITRQIAVLKLLIVLAVALVVLKVKLIPFVLVTFLSC